MSRDTDNQAQWERIVRILPPDLEDTIDSDFSFPDQKLTWQINFEQWARSGGLDLDLILLWASVLSLTKSGINWGVILCET